VDRVKFSACQSAAQGNRWHSATETPLIYEEKSPFNICGYAAMGVPLAKERLMGLNVGVFSLV